MSRRESSGERQGGFRAVIRRNPRRTRRSNCRIHATRVQCGRCRQRVSTRYLAIEQRPPRTEGPHHSSKIFPEERAAVLISHHVMFGDDLLFIVPPRLTFGTTRILGTPWLAWTACFG